MDIDADWALVVREGSGWVVRDPGGGAVPLGDSPIHVEHGPFRYVVQRTPSRPEAHRYRVTWWALGPGLLAVFGVALTALAVESLPVHPPSDGLAPLLDVLLRAERGQPPKEPPMDRRAFGGVLYMPEQPCEAVVPPTRSPEGRLLLCSDAILLGPRRRASVQPVVARAMGAIRGCFHRALRENPAMTAAFRVSVAIYPDGRTGSPRVRGDLPSEAARACVERRFGELRLPPTGERLTIAFLRFVLAPQ